MSKNEIKNNKNTTKKQANKKIAKSNSNKKYINNNLKMELICILIICLSLILIISIFFGSGGLLGKLLSSFLKGIFGIGAYILPLSCICFSIYLFFKEDKKVNIFKFVLSIVIFTFILTLFHIISKNQNEIFENYGKYLLNEYNTGSFLNGGVIGAIFGDLLLKIMGTLASYIFISIIIIASIVLLSGKSFFITIQKLINQISNYFYYEYPINDKIEEEIKVKEKKSPNILSGLKSKFKNKPNPTKNNNIKNEEITPNKKLIKKYNNYIFDGNDKYKKVEKPKFFNMNIEEKQIKDKKISLAINEINNNKSFNNIPEFLQKKNTYKPKEQHQIFENDEFNLYQNTYTNEIIEKDKIINTTANIIKDYENETSFNYFGNDDLNKKSSQNFNTLESGEIGFSIDFDLPSNSEIEELFQKSSNEFFSEEIDFDSLEKLNDFYNFDNNTKNEKLNEEEKSENYNEFTEIEQIIPSTVDEPLQNNNEINQITEQPVITKIPKFENFSSENTKPPINEPINPPVNEPVIIKAEKEKLITNDIVQIKKEYIFPKLSFLSKNSTTPNTENDIELRENSNTLIKTLKSFNINAQVINISKGPSVTRYELSIEDGIKVSKILGLSDNLALSLAASSIRIEAPIPGKSAVGIEIPNKEINSVFLSEVIWSKKFQNSPSKISFGLGKDITGNVIVTDIAKMPHMLIAGATGSGKSVCINTLITSILYKASPDEVKLILIDPKVVELSVYNGIPHLLTPVVTEPEKAAGVLNWAIAEMMERYKLFAETGLRNIIGYNQLQEEKKGEKLPQIVIIIDELADLMMVASKEVEASICRLAQLARAAGIHLIIATQRPSVDVITGLIKSNIPSRIAFAVSSGTDSRTILDTVGAEKLLGKGDMLFRSVDMNKPLRIQCAFISDKEVEQIVTFIKQNGEANYDQEIINKINASNPSDSNLSEDYDEITEDVISFLVRKGKASTSMIQRQFRIGYNRAARIIEELEERGIISQENGSKQRDVLMDKYQFEEYLDRKNY